MWWVDAGVETVFGEKLQTLWIIMQAKQWGYMFINPFSVIDPADNKML